MLTQAHATATPRLVGSSQTALPLPSPPLSPGEREERLMQLPQPLAIPNVEFDDTDCGSPESESPILGHPYMSMSGLRVGVAGVGVGVGPEFRGSRSPSPSPSPIATQTPPNAPSPPPPPPAVAIALPQILIESPVLSMQFAVRLGVRIQALRLLLLDVNGAPVVPIDHLGIRLALGRGKRLSHDVAAEAAAAILLSLEHSSHSDAESVHVSDDNEDDEDLMPDRSFASLSSDTPPNDNNNSHSSSGYFPCSHFERSSSEMGAQSKPFIRSTPSCTCPLCLNIDSNTTSNNNTTALKSYLLPNPEEVAAARDAECYMDWVLHKHKQDYHDPLRRQASVWEDRFGEFADAQGLYPVCRSCRRMQQRRGENHGRGRGSSSSQGMPRSLHLDSFQTTEADDREAADRRRFAMVGPSMGQEALVGDDGDDDDVEDSDSEQDYDPDEDEDEDEDDGEEDDESSSLDEHDIEEFFLDNYLQKLQELFGLLEVNAKLEDIEHVCR